MSLFKKLVENSTGKDIPNVEKTETNQIPKTASKESEFVNQQTVESNRGTTSGAETQITKTGSATSTTIIPKSDVPKTKNSILGAINSTTGNSAPKETSEIRGKLAALENVSGHVVNDVDDVDDINSTIEDKKQREINQFETALELLNKNLEENSPVKDTSLIVGKLIQESPHLADILYDNEDKMAIIIKAARVGHEIKAKKQQDRRVKVQKKAQRKGAFAQALKGKM